MDAFRCFVLALFVLVGADYARADRSRAETTPAAPVSTSGPEFRMAVEKKTFELINAYRLHYGVGPLAWNEDLAKLARAHSKDMAEGEVEFGHDGFQDRVDAAKQKLANVRGAGENVLYTSNLDDVAEKAVQMWLHSPHHLKNIRGEYNYSGLGVWQTPDGTIYFTQLFVKTD